MVACLVTVGGILSSTAASPQNTTAPAAATDVYHVHFAKAAPGQAAALGKSLMVPDKASPMPEHVVVLRHQEGDDWDYVVIRHLGSKVEVAAAAPPPSDAVRALGAWHSDTFVSGHNSWQDVAPERAAAASAGDAADGWADIRQHSAFHRDTLIGSIPPSR